MKREGFGEGCSEAWQPGCLQTLRSFKSLFFREELHIPPHLCLFAAEMNEAPESASPVLPPSG